MTEIRSVPCNGCRVCCIRDIIVLHPEHGDVIADYLHQATIHPFTGKPCHILQRKDNGECVYLDENGCTIHDRAPTICREFDCRQMVKRFTRKERRELVRRGFLAKDMLEAGRQRLHTLEDHNEQTNHPSRSNQDGRKGGQTDRG